MEELDLVTIIEEEVNSSIGGDGAGTGSYAGGSSGTKSNSYSAQLSAERAMELDYYNSRPFGNEKDGESQVVSSDVFDAVEGMLPHLLKTFTASDDAVEFEPEGPEDEEQAKQRTDACNYVFYRQNNGFLVMYEWFKDALLQKNGIVKYWWEEKTDISDDEYQGLTEGEFLMMAKGEGVEILSDESYDDPVALEKKQEIIAKIQAMPMPPAQPMQIGAGMQPQPPNPQDMIAQVNAQPVPQLHNVKIRTTKDVSHICIKAIPPEEFGISSKQTTVSIQDAPFCYHRTKMTLSALRQMGCPEEVIAEINAEDSQQDIKPEVLARNRFIDESSSGGDANVDESRKEVWVVDCFLRIDFDGDGIAELRHIIMPSRTIWINEPSSHINFAAITPIIMPHRFVGKSIAEIVMDFQFMNSVLLRQMFNNLYLSNNPQKVVLGTAGGQVMADIDRLMTSRVGGILVEYAPNAIRNQEVPFVAGASFPMLEYMEGKKEQRTGNTRYNQGTDADSLNKTARGIQMIQSASQQKIDLIARIFAETGVKDLFRGIAYYLSKYSSRKMTMRLRNKWVDIDPREWKNQFDMTVNVGLGSGNKDAQLVHLVKMHEMQVQLMQEGKGYMVTDQNIYNLAKKTAENMGFKHPEIFISDPATVKPPPPAPNPEILKLQQADQEIKMKIQSNEKIRQFDAQTNKELEQIKSQSLIAIAQMQEATKKAIAEMQVQADMQIAVFKENSSMRNEATQLQTEKQQIGVEKLALNYDKSIHAINKSVSKQSGERSDLVVVDTAGNVASQLTKSLSSVADAISNQAIALHNQGQTVAAVQNQTAALAHEVAKLSNSSTQNIAAVMQIAKAGKDKASAPRVHKVKKVADGYEITSTVQ